MLFHKTPHHSCLTDEATFCQALCLELCGTALGFIKSISNPASMVNLQFIRFNYILAGERLSIAAVIFFSRRYSYRRHKTNHRGKRNRLKIFRILAGAAVDICCSFLYAVLHPEIRICGGHCRPQCGAGSDDPGGCQPHGTSPLRCRRSGLPLNRSRNCTNMAKQSPQAGIPSNLWALLYLLIDIG